jgi:hypothetical protein
MQGGEVRETWLRDTVFELTCGSRRLSQRPHAISPILSGRLYGRGAHRYPPSRVVIRVIRVSDGTRCFRQRGSSVFCNLEFDPYCTLVFMNHFSECMLTCEIWDPIRCFRKSDPIRKHTVVFVRKKSFESCFDLTESTVRLGWSAHFFGAFCRHNFC